MKLICLSLLAVLTLDHAVATARAAAADQDGVALAIVYDTSGSMGEEVRDTNDRKRPKYQVANRALITLVEQIDAYAKNAGGVPRSVEAGLYVFNNGNPRTAIPLGPFDAGAIKKWAEHFASPSGSTPLGESVSVAGAAVLKSPFSRKHILVITDGVNTAGPAPAITIPRLRKDAGKLGAAVSLHFVAFDVDAKEFEPVKKLDATVVSAMDEKQLNTQLDYILRKKILLEDEEPKK